MKTPAIGLSAILLACSDPSEPASAAIDLSVRSDLGPIRGALFGADTANDPWFVCEAGERASKVTFTIASDGKAGIHAAATYSKASFYTGYVVSTVALGDVRLTGTYPKRTFSFRIGGEPARIEAESAGVSEAALHFGGAVTRLSCAEYDAPYSVDDPFGPRP
jgi:hypothetical protein